jgi:DNA-binding response OmpR family regulator
MAKILVVDDDPDIVETTRLVLEKVGYQVFSANSRTQGLKVYEECSPDLIMLDVMMEEPDDGIAMAQDLRKKGCKKPILMLTSLDKVTGFKYDKDSGLVPVDDYHEKPMDPAKLVARVAELLKK